LHTIVISVCSTEPLSQSGVGSLKLLFLPVTKLQRSNVHLMPLDSVHVTLPDCWDLIKQTQKTDWSRYKYNATPNWGWGQPARMWWLSLSPCVRPCWRSGSIVRRVFLPRSLMMTNGRQQSTQCGFISTGNQPSTRFGGTGTTEYGRIARGRVVRTNHPARSASPLYDM